MAQSLMCNSKHLALVGSVEVAVSPSIDYKTEYTFLHFFKAHFHSKTVFPSDIPAIFGILTEHFKCPNNTDRHR